MLDPKVIDDLSKKLAGSLPAGLVALNQDIKDNLHATLEAALTRMNLVTREEFDVQAAVLARTRARLAELEAKIAQLEQQR